MKKFGFIAMVGVFCLLMSGCLSFSPREEIPEAERADIADIPKLLLGTWKDNYNNITYIFDENGKFVKFTSAVVLGDTYKIVDNTITLSGIDYRDSNITESWIIQIDKTGKKSTLSIGNDAGIARELKKIDDNHDLTVYVEQKRQQNEKAEAEAQARKVAAGFTDAGIIGTRTIIANYKHLNPNYVITINFSIKKINGKDPVQQIGNNYWVPAGRSEITYGITSKFGDALDIEIRGISGWGEGSTEGTVEYYFVDGGSYDLIFEMTAQQVSDLILKNTMATGGDSVRFGYYAKIEPR